LLLGAVRILLVLQATVSGTVRDGATGEPLAGATVALGALRVATADSLARYELRQVPPGNHRVTIRFIGYVPRSIRVLVPRDGRLEIDISLHAQPVRLQTLEVTAQSGRAAGDLVSAAFPDRTITVGALWAHPLLAEPDAFQAMAGGEVVQRPESPAGIHVRGGMSDQTAYLLNDVPVFSPYHAAGVFSAWNPDALAAVQLQSSAPAPEYGSALSGAFVAETRTPGARLHTQGGVSTTQARLTVDGPLGIGAISYLVSVRSNSPAVVAPRDEASYVRGEAGDRLVTLETPAFGGRLRFLDYDNQNELNTAAGADRRNAFDWQSSSRGGEWRRAFSHTVVRLLGWSAAGRAGAKWSGQVAPLTMQWSRRDAGLLASVEHRSAAKNGHACLPGIYWPGAYGRVGSVQALSSGTFCSVIRLDPRSRRDCRRGPCPRSAPARRPSSPWTSWPRGQPAPGGPQRCPWPRNRSWAAAGRPRTCRCGGR